MNYQRVIQLICILLLSISYSAHAEGSKTTKSDLHLYLLIGQSNMAGRAPYSDDDAQPIPRCYLLNTDNKWEEAKNPLNRHSTIRKDLKMQKMGPGYGFAKAMLEQQKGIHIGLIVNAKGGTRISQWQKGTEFYDEAIKRARKAMESGTLKGILWHQGESNSKKPNSYLKNLEKLITDLRKDLNSPELPFIAGEIFYHPEHKPHTDKINKQISQLPQKISFTASVSSKDLTTFDHTHFDTDGAKKLGTKYAEAMLAIQAKAKKK